MYKYKSLCAALLLSITCLHNAGAQPSAFGGPRQVPATPESAAPSETSAEMPQEVSEDPVTTAIQAMDLQTRIAQLMLITTEGTHAPSTEDLGFMKACPPGGVVIPRILKPEVASVYVQKLRGLEMLTGVPLLVGANLYELVRRERGAPSAFMQLPSMLALAAVADDEMTQKVGNLLAEHMQVMGFNLHLGPTLDLAPTLPKARGTINTFGSDPEFVAEAALTFHQCFKEHNILFAATGFPGGGMNREPLSHSQDDLTPAVLLTPRPLLMQTDLRPYSALIEADVPLLHVGNTFAPTLDTTSRPASVSDAIMKSLLRDTLGFEGVILAGPLDHGDVGHLYDPAEAALLALQNGADMLYWQGRPNAVKRVIEHLVRAVEEKKLSETLLNASVKRILTMKYVRPEKTELEEKKMRRLEKKKDLQDIAYQVERRALTLVQNRNQCLPFTKKNSMPVGITGVVELDELQTLLEKKIHPISQQRITTAQHLGEIQDFEIERLTAHARGVRTVVCVFTDNMRPEGPIKLIRAFKDKGANVVAVLMGYPEHLPLLAEADAILLAYCTPADYAQTLRGIADILLGESPLGFLPNKTELTLPIGEERVFDVQDIVRTPAGRLPVTLSDYFQAGLSVPYNPTRAIKKARWDFGNGKKKKDLRVTYAYKEPGRYPITLTLIDCHGLTTERIFQAVVR